MGATGTKSTIDGEDFYGAYDAQDIGNSMPSLWARFDAIWSSTGVVNKKGISKSKMGCFFVLTIVSFIQPFQADSDLCHCRFSIHGSKLQAQFLWHVHHLGVPFRIQNGAFEEFLVLDLVQNGPQSSNQCGRLNMFLNAWVQAWAGIHDFDTYTLCLYLVLKSSPCFFFKRVTVSNPP